MGQPNPTQTVTNPRIAKLIELKFFQASNRASAGADTYRAQGLALKKIHSGNSLVEIRASPPGFTNAR